MVTLWAAVLGLKGILHHQMADREHDIQSGTVTFATKTRPAVAATIPDRLQSPDRASGQCPPHRRGVRLVPSGYHAFIIYYGSEVTKYLLGFKFALTADPATIRGNLPFTNEMFYVLWMPMASATQIGLDNRALISLPILHTVIFHQPVVQQLGDWLAIIKNATLVYRGRCGMRGH